MTIKTEKIELTKLPMGQRKYWGRLAENALKGGLSLSELKTLLRENIETCTKDSRAGQWLLAHLSADPYAEDNCRLYIGQLLYG